MQLGVYSTSVSPMDSVANSCGAATETVTEDVEQKEPLVLRLRATQPYDGPRVTWAEGVIDNEHLGRLKSNCCCIYTKPRVWDDPSTWEQDENETEHCRGHTLPPPPDNDKKDDKDKKHSNHGGNCC